MFDVAVVGAGIIGLATARKLLERRPDLGVAVLEKEERIGAHQTGHNSGVLHAGVYYAPGSLKARLCVRGKAELERFAEERAIPFERCGKVIVARSTGELGRMETLRQRAVGNGLAGVRTLSPGELAEIEPNVVGAGALHVPETAIIDFARVASALADELAGAGATLHLGHRVLGLHEHMPSGLKVGTSRGDVVARHAIVCAGLHSDRLRPRGAGRPDLQIVPFRGDYYTLTDAARPLVRGLVYPVPDPTLPFLGVHFTRRIDGDIWAGPNAVLALAREGYRRSTFSAADMAELVRFAGFWRLSRRYWRTGLLEMWRDLAKPAFVRALQAYVPALSAADLVFGPSGVRAQAVRADGTMVDDFVIDHCGRVLYLRNAPSPGATASLAIGDYLVGQAIERFGL